MDNNTTTGYNVQAAHDARLAKIHKAVGRGRKFAEFLRDYEPNRASNLRSCGCWLLFHRYIQRDETKLAQGNFCQQALLCEFCAAGRAAKQAAKLAERIQFLLSENPSLKPYMVTLTMRNQPQLAPMVKSFWNAWSALVRKRRNAKSGKTRTMMSDIEGGFLAGEAKRGKTSKEWHYHGHGILLSDIDRYAKHRKKLTEEWAEQLGQSWASTQFAPITGDLSDALRETVKYALKFTHCSYDDHLEAFDALTRVRRIRCFGSLHGIKLPEGVADDLEGLEAEEYIEMLYRWLPRGYQLVPLGSDINTCIKIDERFR